MAAYNRLYYNRVDLVYDGSQIRVAPNFLCPVCAGRPQALLERTWNCNLNRSLDVNQLVTYTLPCCGNTISLYLGIHKERNASEIMCLLAVKPFPDWWWQA